MTKQEFEDTVLKLMLKDAHRYDAHFEVRYDPNRVTIEFGGMYDMPVINVHHLTGLLNMYEASNVVVEDGKNNAGCETCDYGSLYTKVIRIMNPKKGLYE